MQLVKLFITGALLSGSLMVAAQNQDAADTQMENDRLWLKKTGLTTTEINILGSYYSQDGNNSAVTGGRGTERLTDGTPTIIVNVPIDSLRQLSVNVGADLVTSASTDNIDFEVSSDSRRDLRYHADITYTRRFARPRLSYSVSGGFSKEYDVFSGSIGASVTKESQDGNTEISFYGKAYFDTWSLFYPVELRPPVFGGEDDDDPQGYDNRNTYSGSLVLSQILTRRLQVSLSAEIIQQEGLLSIPFNRVFFDDGINVDGLTTLQVLRSNKLRRVENLPRSRTRIPLGMRINYYLGDIFVLRGYYRYYTDDFDLTGHTASLDVPVKITPYLVFTPFYRYHTQTASKYFKPFGEHDIAAEYYSSDYDNSAFSSHKLGVGLRYSPLYNIGIFKTPLTARDKHKYTRFKAIEVRYAFYDRSDGLQAWIISFDLSFDLARGKPK